MKKAPKGKTLPVANTTEVMNLVVASKLDPRLADLLHVLADACDEAASGQDIYITLGTTKRKDALLLTVSWDGDKTMLSGVTLLDLASQAGTLL